MSQYSFTHDDIKFYPESVVGSFLNKLFYVLKENNVEVSVRRPSYRGHISNTFELRPSVFRDNYLEAEEALVRDFRLMEPNEFPKENNAYENLIKMQHYGLPTRLLDITYNPLVARFFACYNMSGNAKFGDDDGAFYIFNQVAQNPDHQQVHYLASLAYYTGETRKTLVEHCKYNRFIGQDEEISDFMGIRFIPVVAPMNNERIKRQNGGFLLFGLNSAGGYRKEVYSLSDETDDFDTIVISGELKKRILWELRVLGIHESFLFPELEHQSKYLKRVYSVK